MMRECDASTELHFLLIHSFDPSSLLRSKPTSWLNLQFVQYSLSVALLTEQGASQLVILGITKSTRLSTNIAIFRTSSCAGLNRDWVFYRTIPILGR